MQEEGLPDAKKLHQADHEDDEEKKAMKAELTYLGAVVKAPKLDLLNQIYSAAKVDESTLKTWKAEWEGMTAKQLDAAIEKAKPLISTMDNVSFEAQSKPTPFGFETPNVPSFKSEFSAAKEFKAIDEMSVKDIFKKSGGHQYA